MTHTIANYEDVEPAADAMHFLREELDTDQLGFTVLECEPGWEGMEHDHADEGHEEVYFLVDGLATIAVEGEDVALEPGDAIRLDPETTRQIRIGDVESTLVLAGAP